MGWFSVSNDAPTTRAKAKQAAGSAASGAKNVVTGSAAARAARKAVTRAHANRGGAVCAVCTKPIAGRAGTSNVHPRCARSMAAGWRHIHEVEE